MFKLKKILPLILCMLVVYTLVSCEEEEKVEESYFPEGFTEVDDYIMPFQTFFNATKGIETRYKEINEAILNEFTDSESLPTINPYEGRGVTLFPEYVDNFEVDFPTGTFPTKYFKVEDGYKYYCHWMMDLEFFIGGVENTKTQELEFCFYRFKGGIGPYNPYIPGYPSHSLSHCINVVEYNGLYSYFFAGSLDISKEYMEYYAHLFYLFYVTEDLPYDVYYTDSNFILLNKNDGFSKACLEEFVKSKEVHYFDRSKIDKYWKNNMDLYSLDWFK